MTKPEQNEKLSNQNQVSISKLEEIKTKSPQLYNFIMEVKQRFGSGKISNLKWRDNARSQIIE